MAFSEEFGDGCEYGVLVWYGYGDDLRFFRIDNALIYLMLSQEKFQTF